MKHLALLGDSTFDNQSYVPAGNDVRGQLRRLAPADLTIDLLARDGAVIEDVAGQVASVNPRTSHLVMSVGGNDALRASSVLQAPVRTVGEAMLALARVADDFGQAYRRLLDGLGAFKGTMAICTIYEPWFADEIRRRAAVTALAVLNDVIVREAFLRQLTLIDLRLICDKPEHFSNEIEPSAAGGERIAGAIINFLAAKLGTAVVR